MWGSHSSTASSATDSAPGAMPVVEVRGLRKQYNGRGSDGRHTAITALDGVDLTVGGGQLVVLLGPSGCGKTTLLRSIAGLERPMEGEIQIQGRTVFSSSAGVFVPPEQRRIGMMFQSYALWPHMTVSENVAYPLSHVAASEKRSRVAEMLERMGVAGLGHRHPGELSGGQQQRVALARALIASQTLLLFDEPLSNVDAKVRRKLRAELRDLKRRNGFGGIYVTHDQEEAMELADILVVIEQGRIRQVASPREVYARPSSRYVAGFVGEVNCWPARVLSIGGGREAVRVACQLGEFDLVAGTGCGRGDEGWVGIRPEHIRVVAAGGATAPGTQRVPALVEDIVYLGPRVECRLRAGGGVVSASMGAEQAETLEAGRPVDMLLPIERLLWLPS